VESTFSHEHPDLGFSLRPHSREVTHEFRHMIS
jgi:hypothetical protein